MKHILILPAVVLALAAGNAMAQNGTWVQLTSGNASGSWQTASNWSGSTIASGSDNTADFNTLNITVNSTVTLDAPVTIGNIIFGDTTTSSAASWIIGNGGNASNTLILNGTSPTITVGDMGTGANAAIDAVISGSSTFTKNGTGTLVLNGVNTFTGAVVVSQGRLVLGNNSSLGTTAGNTTVSSGATLDLNGRNIGGESLRLSGTGDGGVGALVNTSATNAGGVRLELLAPATVGGTGRIDTIFSGTVLNGGNHTLTKTGTGTLVINAGTVTNVGDVDVQQGTISIVNNTSTFDSATFGASVASSANLTFFHNSGGAMTFNRTVTLANNASLRSSSSLLAVTQSGNVVLSAGNATIESVTSNPAHVNNFIISGNISGAGGFIKTGTANLTLTGTNTYVGNTTVSAGTLRVNTLSLPGNVTNNAALVFNQTFNGTFTPLISGSGTFEKAGTGALTLNGSNSFTGAALVSEGLLILGNNSALGTTAGNTTVSLGATLDLNGRNVGGELIRISGSGVGGNGAFVNNSGSAATGQGGFFLALLADATIGGTGRMDTEFSGTVISANGFSLSKNGSNLLVINGATTLETFNINQGSVSVVNTATGLGNATSSVNVASGASLQLFNSTGATITRNKPVSLANNAELAGTTATSVNALSGNVTLSGGNATIRVEASGTGTLLLSGSLTGPGGFNKTSAGTLLLTGASDYTGATTVTGGSLVVNGSLGGTSGVTVLSGGTLGGNGTIAGPVAVNGILAPGTSPGTLSFSNALTLNGTLQLEITGTGAGQFDVLDGATTLTLGGILAINNTGYTPVLNDTVTVFSGWTSITGSFSSITGTDLGGGLSWDTSALATTGTLTVIPEPSTWALLAAGLTALAIFRRRNRTA